jgi:hypothetical protein
MEYINFYNLDEIPFENEKVTLILLNYVYIEIIIFILALIIIHLQNI